MPYTTSKPYCVITAVVVPQSYVVKYEGTDADTLCKEFTEKELRGLDLSEVDVKVEHEGNIVFGNVVKSYYVDGIGLLVMLEIPIVRDDTRPNGDQRIMNKKKLIAMAAEAKVIKDVSLSHHADFYQKDGSWYATKRILEVSVTMEGAKENSRIYEVKWFAESHLKNKSSNSADKTVKVPYTVVRLPARPVTFDEENSKYIVKYSKHSHKMTTPSADQALMEKIIAYEKQLEEKNKKLSELEQKANLYDETIKNYNEEAVSQLNKLSKKNKDAVMEMLKKTYGGQELDEEMAKLENADKDEMVMFEKLTREIQQPGSEKWNPSDFVNFLASNAQRNVTCCNLLNKQMKLNDGSSVGTKFSDPSATGGPNGASSNAVPPTTTAAPVSTPQSASAGTATNAASGASAAAPASTPVTDTNNNSNTAAAASGSKTSATQFKAFVPPSKDQWSKMFMRKIGEDAIFNDKN